jgi:hypothetical protein
MASPLPVPATPLVTRRAVFVSLSQLTQKLAEALFSNHICSNRELRRFESVVTLRKQTAGTRLNRQLRRTSRIQLSSNGVWNHRSRGPVHDLRITSQELRATVTSNNVELAASAKKQQIRESNLNSVGCYFLVVYAYFQIGRQRALRHNRCTKEVRNYSDKDQAALVEMEKQS